MWIFLGFFRRRHAKRAQSGSTDESAHAEKPEIATLPSGRAFLLQVIPPRVEVDAPRSDLSQQSWQTRAWFRRH